MILFEVIGNRRRQSSIHIALNKKLVADISNQTKKPTVVISTNTANCYDRIDHLFTSMSCKYSRL